MCIFLATFIVRQQMFIARDWSLGTEKDGISKETLCAYATHITAVLDTSSAHYSAKPKRAQKSGSMYKKQRRIFLRLYPWCVCVYG